MDNYRYTQANPFVFRIADEIIFEAERLGIFYTIGSGDPYIS